MAIKLTLFGTPVRVHAAVLLVVVALWGGVTRLGLYWHPGRGFWQALLIGFAATILLLLADFGHALAHIFSARYAGAPMDEISISAMDMPRTIYYDNEVSPEIHRMRALGGPIFNLLGLLLSLVIYAAAPGSSIAAELAVWSMVGHGLLFILSLLPLPIVDGGTILKWTLVARGRTQAEADEIIRRIDWLLGLLALIAGVVLIAMKIWMIGLIFIGSGFIVMLVAGGKIR